MHSHYNDRDCKNIYSTKTNIVLDSTFEDYSKALIISETKFDS